MQQINWAEVGARLLTFAYLINLLFTIMIVFLERKKPTSTLVWLLTLFVLPGVGAILYFFLAQNILRRKSFAFAERDEDYRQRNLDLLQSIRRLHEGGKIFRDSRLEPYRDIIQFLQVQSRALYSQDNELRVFTDGRAKFNDLFGQIRTARDHVHVLYYILKKDELGRGLLDLLIRKAQEGVEVRLLVDAIGNAMPRRELARLKRAGGHVARFFPSFFTFINLKLNYRNHRKIVVIDGQTGYVGGFNVGNEYLGLKKSMGYWRDTHLRIRGSAVHDLQTRFFQDWLLAAREKLPVSERYYPQPQDGAASGVQIVSCGPDREHEDIKLGFVKMIHAAKKSIYIQTPYFIPDESISESLAIAALSGIDVNLMIPCKPDHPFVYWATCSFVGDLLQSGVKAYVYKGGFLHSKTIVVDDRIASVGTANFDIRSFRLNYEVNAFIYDVPTAKALQAAFIKDIAASDELTLDGYRRRSPFIMFKESISRLLAPIL
ncbi:MAG: cardiolipin synthase [Gracilibacteraceae bacterium]|jgi:cardiolipin synthase|nr:cardiolipin synthase [Gracilibacteraceae bacterium]